VLGWILVYIIIWRGLHASGKVREAVCTNTHIEIKLEQEYFELFANSIRVTK
jgi:hypothetical protein